MKDRIIIPNGWKLVPIEPTEEMIDAGGNTFIPCYTGTPVSDPGSVWDAMIKATPDYVSDKCILKKGE